MYLEEVFVIPIYNSNVKSEDGDMVLLVIYLDDIIVIVSEVREITMVNSELCYAFDMIDLGLLHYCLGVEVW